MSENEMIKFEEIQSRIYTIHDVQVMLDEDLAKFYGVETRVLNQAVKRNINRFPESYMFQLAEDETDDLMSQYVISSSGHGGRRKLPYVFTEQGVAMLAAVLRSDTAIKMSIQIINAFVAMRRFITTNAHIFQRLDTLEIKQINTDKKIDAVLMQLREKKFNPNKVFFLMTRFLMHTNSLRTLFEQPKDQSPSLTTISMMKKASKLLAKYHHKLFCSQKSQLRSKLLHNWCRFRGDRMSQKTCLMSSDVFC
jgi:hypothetical protein